MTAPLLALDQVSLSFGGLKALDGITIDVQQSELFAIIGPNGAGKTSVFNCISGVYRPHSGRITFQDKEITGVAPHRIAANGIARTFQNVEVFPTMTVIENLLLGRHHHMRTGVVAGAVWAGRARGEEIRNRCRVEEVVDFLEIQPLRHQQVGSLPHGLQKRVELGRALAAEPSLLLLDEPVAGMNQEETEDMVRFILDVKEELGISVVIVEHDMAVVMGISDRIAVFDFGRLVAVGSPADIGADARVRQAYLGAESFSGDPELRAKTAAPSGFDPLATESRVG